MDAKNKVADQRSRRDRCCIRHENGEALRTDSLPVPRRVTRFTCPACGTAHRAASPLAGKPVRCVRCGSECSVPHARAGRASGHGPPSGEGGDSCPRPAARGTRKRGGWWPVAVPAAVFGVLLLAVAAAAVLRNASAAPLTPPAANGGPAGAGSQAAQPQRQEPAERPGVARARLAAEHFVREVEQRGWLVREKRVAYYDDLDKYSYYFRLEHADLTYGGERCSFEIEMGCLRPEATRIFVNGEFRYAGSPKGAIRTDPDWARDASPVPADVEGLWYDQAGLLNRLLFQAHAGQP